MQIRLTVLGPRSGRAARSYDVLVTAPAGTPLAAVAGALATGSGSGQPARASGSTPVLYAGADRLDPQTAVLGVPPLVDGAVLALHAPADTHAGPRPAASAAARLHVIGGPDAGGVHLLQGGKVRIGRSADADVPLDDPDVSRLHCEVTVGDDGRVTVADLRSTNGTSVDDRPVGEQAVPLPGGALLRLGESTLCLEPPTPGAVVPSPPPSIPAIPDGDGHLRVSLPPAAWPDRVPGATPAAAGGGAHTSRFSAPGATGRADGPPRPTVIGGRAGGHPTAGRHDQGAGAAPAGGPAAQGDSPARPSATRGEDEAHPRHDRTPGAPVPEQPAADRARREWLRPARGAAEEGRPAPGDAAPGRAAAEPDAERRPDAAGTASAGSPDPASRSGQGDMTIQHRWTGGGPDPRAGTEGSGRQDTPGSRMASAIGAWARRLTAGRPEAAGAEPVADDDRLGAEAAALRQRWPDPAEVLLTALGPGPRLWERGAGHPDALTVRLGTADLLAEDGFGTLPAVPFTVDLRDPHTYALGLAGPRPRLAGLARSVIAQLVALHPPSTLEVVLVSADRGRPAEQRAEEWAWLNWLPHLRPAHGQDCRLLLALSREQAEARTAELVRRLEDGALGPAWAAAGPDAVAQAADHREGPYTLLVVDGDPGSAALREAIGRIASTGPSAGVHVLCLAERPELLAAECGALALLEGDVATALRIEPYGPERMTLDAVSSAWAERFSRAIAPLREGDAAGPASRSALPETARLLDALDLALATPAKITARWSDAARIPAGSGSVPAVPVVLGVGPAGSVVVDLVSEGPHLLAGGAPGSGKTELLRSVAAAVAAADRPDRLALVLVDGGGLERGEGLRCCTDLPHVSTYLSATDPLRMREFAQALSAELKRREAVLEGVDFDRWRRPAVPRQSSAAVRADGRKPSEQGSLRLQIRTEPPVPRLVVLVDDFDALVAPALGSTGRPAAGSVVRALEAVARDGARLGVHLITVTGRPERTAETDADEQSRLRIALRTEEPESAALLVAVDDPAGIADSLVGRGYLRRPGGAVLPFQTGRITGRIPRTATLRPTVVPLEWERMGDPPARRTPRELGNGPTDLALLASALQRAADSAGAEAAPPLV